MGSLLDRRYLITAHVATGGMGAIYKGEDTRLQRPVAVKEMLDFFQDHEERKYAVQRFREEALLLGNLTHPNIPRVTDNFIENNRYYLIMDFVEGKDTLKILREQNGPGLPEIMVVKWAIQAADVLYYLHTRKPPIIYRDMKPSNIMVEAGDKVMVVDFGIARHFTPRRPGTMIGTQGYAPPEQYKGETEPRSDIYALAATMHHLLTAQDPTKGVPFTFKPVRQWRSGLSAEIERILSKALHNLPEMRYVNAGEMKEDLEELLEKLATGTGRTQASTYLPPSTSQVTQPQMPPPNAGAQPGTVRQPAMYYQSRQSGSDARDHFARGKEYAEDGDYQKARKELEKAIKMSPDYPEAHCLMGFIMVQTGRSREAVAHLRKAVSMRPASATAHLYLSKAYARMGEINESQKEYQIARRLDPSVMDKGKKGPSLLEQLIRSFLP